MDCRSPKPGMRSAARRARPRARSIPAPAVTPARAASPTITSTASRRSTRTGSRWLDDNLYWNDGQMRDEVYNWGSFVQSRMHAQGVTCSDCHDPHSLKLQGRRQRRVRAVPPAGEVRRAVAHASRGRARRRAACDVVPHADDDVHGRRSAPRSFVAHSAARCLGKARNAECVQRSVTPRESAQWAADAIRNVDRQIAGELSSISPTHCMPVRRGGPGARGALVALIDDKAQPAIVRASAISRLGHWLTAATLGPVTRALNDTDRRGAAGRVEAIVEHALRRRGSALLRRMLDDPVRAVRIEAARALAGAPSRG